MLTVGSITAISSLRLAALAKLDFTDFSWDMLEAICWTVVEVSVAIINACFPMLRPAMKRLVPSLVPSSVNGQTADNSQPIYSVPASRRGDKDPSVRSSCEEDEVELTRVEKGLSTSMRSVPI